MQDVLEPVALDGQVPDGQVPDDGPVARRWSLRPGRIGLVLVAFLVVGNAAILAAAFVTRALIDHPPAPDVAITNFRAIDGAVWRGAAPGPDGLQALAAAGATTIIDLRAEHDLEDDDALVRSLGMTRHHLPIRDGQVPSDEQTEAMLSIIDGSDGPVFLHCGAGVGRTGAMAAWYLKTTGQASGATALGRNLAVGPPSLEQIAFALVADDGRVGPGATVTAVSRVLDAPRRIWHNIT